jgi:hypothetical protein
VVPDSDSDDEFVPFAWAKKPVAPEVKDQKAAVDEDPLGLATAFSGQVWVQIEDLETTTAKGVSAPVELDSAAWRAQIQQVVKRASEQQSSGSASSAGETLQVAHTMLVEKFTGNLSMWHQRRRQHPMWQQPQVEPRAPSLPRPRLIPSRGRPIAGSSLTCGTSPGCDGQMAAPCPSTKKIHTTPWK